MEFTESIDVNSVSLRKCMKFNPILFCSQIKRQVVEYEFIRFTGININIYVLLVGGGGPKCIPSH